MRHRAHRHGNQVGTPGKSQSFRQLRDHSQRRSFVHNMHISPFEQGNRSNPTDPTRARKLLLKKKVEINKLLGASKQEGYTLVPLKVYIRNGFAKLLLGLGKGKKQYDKRETAAKRDAQRDIQRALRDRQKVAR